MRNPAPLVLALLAASAIATVSTISLAAPPAAPPVNTTPAVAYIWQDFTNPVARGEEPPPATLALDDAHPGPVSQIGRRLMAHRQAQSLYLLGDDHFHCDPARVGAFGWGLSIGIVF